MESDPRPELCYVPECPRTDLIRDAAGKWRVFRIPVVVDAETGRVDVYGEGYSCPAHRPIVQVD